MKLYHATTDIETADEIIESGFVATFDHNHQAEVICLADKPLTGFGSWQDAWVVVDVPESEASKYRYEFDDDMYHAKCFAFPANVINKFEMYATTINEYYDYDADNDPDFEDN